MSGWRLRSRLLLLSLQGEGLPFKHKKRDRIEKNTFRQSILALVFALSRKRKKGKLYYDPYLITGRRIWTQVQDRRQQKARTPGSEPVRPTPQWISSCTELWWISGSAISSCWEGCACPEHYISASCSILYLSVIWAWDYTSANKPGPLWLTSWSTSFTVNTEADHAPSLHSGFLVGSAGRWVS